MAESSVAKKLTKEEKYVVAFAVVAWIVGFLWVFGLPSF